jgi:sarcosine oxidase
MADFQFMIIGAGMMGAAAARHLSKTSQSVALIGPSEPADIKNHHGVFASHYDQARITRSLDADPVLGKLAIRSIERHRGLEEDSGISFYEEVGCLFFGADHDLSANYQQAAHEAARVVGGELETLQGNALADAFPMIAFNEGDKGVFERRRAGYINPRRLVEAQCKVAEAQGATIIRETVSGVTAHADYVEVSTSSGQTYRAEKVLIAAGGFSNMNDLLPKPLDLRPTGRTVVFFELDEERQKHFETMPSTVLLEEHEDDIVYILPPVLYPDGKVYLKIGGENEKGVINSMEEARRWFHGEGTPEQLPLLTEIACRLMPALKGAPVTSAACVATMTASGYPYIGYSDQPNVGVMTGGNFVSAKSSDELGRLGAKLLAEGSISDEYGALFVPQYRTK